jgi:hypothetical protein
MPAFFISRGGAEQKERRGGTPRAAPCPAGQLSPACAHGGSQRRTLATRTVRQRGQGEGNETRDASRTFALRQRRTDLTRRREGAKRPGRCSGLFGLAAFDSRAKLQG